MLKVKSLGKTKQTLQLQYTDRSNRTGIIMAGTATSNWTPSSRNWINSFPRAVSSCAKIDYYYQHPFTFLVST